MEPDVNRIETVNTKMVYDKNKVHQPTTLNEWNILKEFQSLSSGNVKLGGNPRKSKKSARKSKKSARKSKRRP